MWYNKKEEEEEMNKGSQIPRYERRDGQWVAKDTGQPIKSINDALSPINCKHEWGWNKGPIPSIALTVPHYYYSCIKCGITTSSCVLIKVPQEKNNKCNHDFNSDPRLGEAYAQYQACWKCGEQK